MSRLLLNIDWENIIFEYKNKTYGAYILRYKYPYYLTFSALIIIAIFLSSMIGPQLFKDKQIQEKPKVKVTVIDYTQLAPPPPIEKIYVPPKTVPVVQAKVQKYVAPVVTVEEVKEEEELPTMEEVIENVDTTNPNIEGIGEGEIIEVTAPPPVAEEPVEVIPPEPEPVISIPPQFPGGDKALVKWLGNHLNYPSMASRLGLEGKVIVEFTVGIDGKVSDITIVQSVHKLLNDEAIRLVKSMPEWEPGVSNQGKNIIAKRKLPIIFALR